MKNIISQFCCTVILYPGLIYAQGKDREIVGSWEYQTMTTIYSSDPQDIITTNKGDHYRETFTFLEDGVFSYRGVYDGIEDAGLGIWDTEKGKLIFNIKEEKTIGNYEINQNILTLIINDRETNEYYGSSSVLKYKKKFTNLKSYKKVGNVIKLN